MVKVSFFILLSVLVYCKALAENRAKPTKPLLEFGVGFGNGFIEDYPASNQSHYRALVLPVARYRGKVFRADEEDDGVRAEVINKGQFEINLSLSASLPASSDRNDARKGMPNLDYILEAGPSLEYYFIREKAEKLFIDLPFRGLATTNFQKFNPIGADVAPEINYEKFGFLCPICRNLSRVVFTFVDRKVANYFYEVEPQYVTNERAAFSGKAGYLGFHIDQIATIEWPNFAIYAGLSYANYSGASNHASPLFKRTETVDSFLGMSWFFYQSAEREYRSPTHL